MKKLRKGTLFFFLCCKGINRTINVIKSRLLTAYGEYKTGKYSSAEYQTIRDMRLNGKSFRVISEKLNRSHAGMRAAWHNDLAHDTGKLWTREDDDKLMHVVSSLLGDSDDLGSIKWNTVAETMGHGKMKCYKRWIRNFSLKTSSVTTVSESTWTTKDTRALIEYLVECEAEDVNTVKWVQAAKLIPNAKSSLWLRRKFAEISRAHVLNHQFCSYDERLDFLARKYVFI